jgi:hypothetical protein
MTAEDAIVVCLFVLLVTIFVGICGIILARAGYSRWYSLILLAVPSFYFCDPVFFLWRYPLILIAVPLDFILLMVLAVREWPIERELARLRLVAGESDDIGSDVERVMSYAIAEEQKRRWNRATSLYNLAAEKSADPGVKQYATQCARRLTDSQ